MSVTSLAGTIWTFNGTPCVEGHTFTFYINFISNNQNFVKFEDGTIADKPVKYYKNDNTSVSVYNTFSGQWYSNMDAYKTIEIINVDTTKTNESEVIAWLEARATMIYPLPHETKLLDVTQFETALTATAIAIRTKSGSSEDITFSIENGFADAIAALPTELDDATGESFGTVIINFTIRGVAYQAENGMTWGDWLNSDYNINNTWSWNGEFINNGSLSINSYNNVLPTPTILIENNAAYTTVNYME